MWYGMARVVWFWMFTCTTDDWWWCWSSCIIFPVELYQTLTDRSKKCSINVDLKFSQRRKLEINIGSMSSVFAGHDHRRFSILQWTKMNARHDRFNRNRLFVQGREICVIIFFVWWANTNQKLWHNAPHSIFIVAMFSQKNLAYNSNQC